MTRENEIKNKYSKSYIMKRKYLTIRDNDIRFMTHGFKILLYIIFLLSKIIFSRIYKIIKRTIKANSFI